jgi:hypothetical protein
MQLGTVEAAEGVLRDLYVDLRRKVRLWSELTQQTPQARMGYVGQHLVSAMTGFPGGRSGARGKDLVLPGNAHAEIKTCSRVDQLGSCNECDARVSSIEVECAECGSTNVLRKDDSKWLISVRNHAELTDLFESQFFFFVLFDFADLANAVDINARIWRVDPRTKAFAYCMIDYFHNIGSRSTSGAPFNMWPFKLKFDLLSADLIFHAEISEDDQIITNLFEGQTGPAWRQPLPPLEKYARSGGEELSVETLAAVAEHLGIETTARQKRALLEGIELERQRRGIPDDALISVLCDALYGRRIQLHLGDLPAGVAPPTFVVA